MKRSELKLTGELYRLTPPQWGEETIMIDEDKIAEEMQKCFDLETVPDPEENGKLETIELAIADGKYYAVLEPSEETYGGHKTGVIYNQNMYRECENPADAVNGAICIYGCWKIFDDEEEATE